MVLLIEILLLAVLSSFFFVFLSAILHYPVSYIFIIRFSVSSTIRFIETEHVLHHHSLSNSELLYHLLEQPVPVD